MFCSVYVTSCRLIGDGWCDTFRFKWRHLWNRPTKPIYTHCSQTAACHPRRFITRWIFYTSCLVQCHIAPPTRRRRTSRCCASFIPLLFATGRIKPNAVLGDGSFQCISRALRRFAREVYLPNRVIHRLKTRALNVKPVKLNGVQY